MKTFRTSILMVAVAGLGVTTLLARSSNSQGTPIVHYSAKVALTNTDADTTITNASGTVAVSEAIQGNANKETLTIDAKGLTPSTDYTIVALPSGTNAPVTTDSKGNLKATFSTNGKSKSNLGPPPTPLTSLTKVDINTSNSTTVLSADMITPTTFRFLDKQFATNTNGPTGSATVSASNKSAKLSISASGLAATNDYALALNDIATTNGTFTSTSKGTLKINASISENVLDLNSVSVLSASNTAVLIFTFP